jgi:hypothetical protein
MNTPFGVRNCFASLSPLGQHALRGAGCLATLGSAFDISPALPKGNANLVWVQHFIHHLAPQAKI